MLFTLLILRYDRYEVGHEVVVLKMLYKLGGMNMREAILCVWYNCDALINLHIN